MYARIVNLTLLIVLVIAIPLSHTALSAKKKAAKKKTAGPPPKVQICHFPEDSAVGHVIEVSAKAVQAHVSKHGDCTAFLARANGDCRCMTCEEQCRAELARCLEAGGSEEECRAAARRCLAECEPPSDG